MRLLIIEDEQDIAEPLKLVFEKQGFAVDFTDNGIDGFNEAKLNEYDCIILDLNLPGMDGIEISKELRSLSIFTPIIMLTARSQQFNKLEGFDNGADDYVTKPFDLQELIARVKSVIRRNSQNQQLELEFSGYKLAPESNQIEHPKLGIIQLSNKETGILEYLVRNKGRYVSTEELLEHVWDREADIFSSTVKTHMKTLRKKVDPEKNLIKTMRGKGYILV